MSPATPTPLLEWLRLVADVAVPLALFGLGLLTKRYLETLVRRRKLFEVESMWRIEVFKELIPRLNDIFCYFTYQGDWRLSSPETITVAKRACDSVVYTNRFLWSNEFLHAYREFSATAFLENAGSGETFLLRANVHRHRENPAWVAAWERRFVPQAEHVSRETFTRDYDRMIRLAVRDLGIVCD